MKGRDPKQGFLTGFQWTPYSDKEFQKKQKEDDNKEVVFHKARGAVMADPQVRQDPARDPKNKMKRGPKKGVVLSPEHLANMKKGKEEAARRRQLEKLDTPCSLYVSYSGPEDFEALRPNCRKREECIIRIIWSKFLLEFKRK